MDGVGEFEHNGETWYSLGQIMATPRALAALKASGVSPSQFVRLCSPHDWEPIDALDALPEATLEALLSLLSVHPIGPPGFPVFIIATSEDAAEWITGLDEARAS